MKYDRCEFQKTLKIKGSDLGPYTIELHTVHDCLRDNSGEDCCYPARICKYKAENEALGELLINAIIDSFS